MSSLPSSTSPTFPRHFRRLSGHPTDTGYSPVPTRSGTLASLLRNRSSQSLSTMHAHGYVPVPPGLGLWSGPDDEESALRNRAQDGEELGKLLKDERRLSQLLNGVSDLRSLKLIGRSNPRYRWERYWKPEEELKTMSKPVRQYYERTNDLIQQYMYIDCLLDSTVPHELLNEYSSQLEHSAFRPMGIPATISEEPVKSTPTDERSALSASFTPGSYGATSTANPAAQVSAPSKPPNRTPKDIFRSSENLPLLQHGDSDVETDAESEDGDAVRNGRGKRVTPGDSDDGSGPRPFLPWLEDAEIDSDDPVVTLAIWVNFAANAFLLAGKIAVIVSVPSMSVLASLVDAVLDFLSTVIVWITTHLISKSHKDQYSYPVGRRRLEPLGVLVFSIIMVTSFCQVALQCIQRLMSPGREVLELGAPAIIIMGSTVVIKGACWVWCRLVKNSSVRALAEDAKTDVIFNIGSILFPIIGFYGRFWWLDAVGGLLLSLVVIFNWSQTSSQHIRNLTGFSAQPDERNLLLYLTMRFATAIRKIQNLRAYHAGDKIFVEVDIVLDAATPLKDSHDLSEVLTYFLESVPIVDRAFVHVDYMDYNAPTHMLKGPTAAPPK